MGPMGEQEEEGERGGWQGGREQKEGKPAEGPSCLASPV